MGDVTTQGSIKKIHRSLLWVEEKTSVFGDPSSQAGRIYVEEAGVQNHSEQRLPLYSERRYTRLDTWGSSDQGFLFLRSCQRTSLKDKKVLWFSSSSGRSLSKRRFPCDSISNWLTSAEPEKSWYFSKVIDITYLVIGSNSAFRVI